MIRGYDIFSGAGGSSAGAQKAGVVMRGAVDLDTVAARTYQDNFPDTQVLTSRLEDVDLPSLHTSIGAIDILLASPECTNHTCAKGGAPRNEASRATAMLAVEYARALRPRWLVLENVIHMRPWSRYGELKRQLAELGYHLGEQIIDSSDHGVPQNRRRLFLVGDRAGAPLLVGKQKKGHTKNAASVLDLPGAWTTSALERPGRASATIERAKRAIEQLGEHEPFLVVYYGTDGCGGWQPLSRPLRTVTTVDRFALVEPGKDGHHMRMLQVPELRRAMGFADGFRFDHGTRRDRVRLLGNAVCPPVMEAVVRALTGLE